jgi:hypothetical protein
MPSHAKAMNETHDPVDAVGEYSVESFAWETVQRVRLLGELTRKYPDRARNVARQILEWPVLSEFGELGDGGGFLDLQLGRDYPLDRQTRSRLHHGSPMGRYLTDWILRVHEFRLAVSFRPQTASGHAGLDEETIRSCWPTRKENGPRSEIVALLKVALELPPLTKATSDEWCKRLLIPLIMLSDAGEDEAACREPALQVIWRQKGVKSAGTFRSRLLSIARQMVRDRVRLA